MYISGGEISLASVTLNDNVMSPAATFMYGGGIHAVGTIALIDSLKATGNSAHIAA